MNPMQNKPIIGVMGASECARSVEELAEQVGRLIARRGAVLLSGGRGGVMAASARGAMEAGGLTVGILKGPRRDGCKVNPYIQIAIRTGLGEARNWVNVSASDVLIAIAGGWGTLSEIALAKKIGKPVILLQSWDLPPATHDAALPVADSAEEAVAMAFEALNS